MGRKSQGGAVGRSELFCFFLFFLSSFSFEWVSCIAVAGGEQAHGR